MDDGHPRKRTHSQSQKALKFRSKYFHLERNVNPGQGVALSVLSLEKFFIKFLSKTGD
jgi:hypothetical protein